MLKEALDFLRDRFTVAAGAKLLNVPGDGRIAYVDQGGTLHQIAVTPPLRGHTVNSVDDLIAAAAKWNASPVVWINGQNIVLVTDDGDRRDRVTLPLVKSAAFSRLTALAKDPELDQAELIRTLRVDLQGTIRRAELLAAVRHIKFRASSSGQSIVQHGNESMGKTIEAEVTGAGDIPETVVVECAVFSNPDEREKSFTVGCDLEIVPADSTFRFQPIPDELERVIDAALHGIRDEIVAELGDVSVFFGSP